MCSAGESKAEAAGNVPATRTRKAAKKSAAPVAPRAPSESVSNKRKASTPAAEMPEAAKRSRALPRKEPTPARKPAAQKPAQSCEAGSSGLRKSAGLCEAKEKPSVSADHEMGTTSAGVSTAGRDSGSKRRRDAQTDEVQAKPQTKRERRMPLPCINEAMPLEEPASGTFLAVALTVHVINLLSACISNSPLWLMPAGLGSISFAEPAKSASTAAPAAVDQATAVDKGRKRRQMPAAAPAQLNATRSLPARAAKTRQAVETPPAELNAQADTIKSGSAEEPASGTSNREQWRCLKCSLLSPATHPCV